MLTKKTATNKDTVSKLAKKSVNSCPEAQPTTTRRGMTKEAICYRYHQQRTRVPKTLTDNRASNTNTNRQLHLSLHGHPDRCYMFSSISDDREKYETDERLGNRVPGRKFLNRGNHCKSSQRKYQSKNQSLTIIGTEGSYNSNEQKATRQREHNARYAQRNTHQAPAEMTLI